MKLAEYLDRHGLSAAAFARRIAVDSRMSVLRYARGERIPRPEIMQRIVETTGGEVQPNDFFDIGDDPSAHSAPSGESPPEDGDEEPSLPEPAAAEVGRSVSAPAAR